MPLVRQVSLQQPTRVEPINLRDIAIPGAFADIAVVMLNPEIRRAECGEKIRLQTTVGCTPAVVAAPTDLMAALGCKAMAEGELRQGDVHPGSERVAAQAASGLFSGGEIAGLEPELGKR